MDMGELDDFLSSKLEFSLDGRHYSVPPIDWETYLELMKVGAHVARVAEGKAKPEDGPEDKPLYERAPVVLGPVFAELQANGVHPSKIAEIARAAYLWQTGNDEAALFVLTGKAPAPTTTSPTPTGSTDTAAANTTKPRGSTSGTRSPKKSQPRNGKRPALTGT